MFDYEGQQMVEKFTAEDIYSVLSDETINTKTTMEHQHRQAQIVYQEMALK